MNSFYLEASRKHCLQLKMQVRSVTKYILSGHMGVNAQKKTDDVTRRGLSVGHRMRVG